MPAQVVVTSGQIVHADKRIRMVFGKYAFSARQCLFMELS